MGADRCDAHHVPGGDRGNKQWLRVYMQSKMIKNNKDLFQLLDDPFALLEQLHIY